MKGTQPHMKWAIGWDCIILSRVAAERLQAVMVLTTLQLRRKLTTVYYETYLFKIYLKIFYFFFRMPWCH